MLDQVKVTFENIKSGQKIIINFINDTEKETLDFKVSYDPEITDLNTNLDLSGFLAETLLKNLTNDGTNNNR